MSRRRDGLFTLLALGLIGLWELSGLDLVLARCFGGASGFPWREAWLPRMLLHDGGRALAVALLGLLGWQAWVGAPDLARAQRRYWFTVMLASALLVPLLKRFSATSCPWDLAEFGGLAAYVPHWVPGLGDGGPGHCFPSGHAVGAFAFIGLYFQWRPSRPRRARRLLAAVLLAGALFGLTQLARGAHFASHVLWSGWLCWALALTASTHAPGRSEAMA